MMAKELCSYCGIAPVVLDNLGRTVKQGDAQTCSGKKHRATHRMTQGGRDVTNDKTIIAKVDAAVDDLVNRLSHTLSENGIKYETTYRVGGRTVRIAIETVGEGPTADSVTYIAAG